MIFVKYFGSNPSPRCRPERRPAALLSVVVAFLMLVVFPISLPRVAEAQALGRTDPNSGLFPDSSFTNFDFLLDAPAGKYGFLKVGNDGHFAWGNGKRAKFWGVNISNRSIWVGKEAIDRVVDVLTRAGANMVRFEAIDSLGGLLDPSDGSTPTTTRRLDPQKLATLDYWVSKIRARGIYYYFDLLDFRQFKVDDEVPGYDQIGRAAKPYAFFDRRLIDLQKEFAQQLLTHRNPLTGLRYVDDPGLALVELCNEHGLFFKANNLDTLVEPYGTAFRQQWNRWLVQQYGSRDGIKAAWGRAAETDVLLPTEDPGTYSVALPLFSPSAAPTSSGDPNIILNVVDVRRAPNRLRDGVRFLYETQRGYFREMKAALREMGLKVPVTGVVSNEYIPDVASAAAECDFTSENYYADHPAFAGKEWEGVYFYNDTNPLRNSSPYQIAPWLATLRWDNKPVVVREWATVWPNRFRAIAIPEMAAYCSLQDFDATLLFGYQVGREPELLSDFDHQADPTVWGLFAMGALTFLRGDIQPAPYSVTLQYTPETVFRWPNSLGNLSRLSWFVRLNSTMKDEKQPGVNLPSPTPNTQRPTPGVTLASRGGITKRQAAPPARLQPPSVVSVGDAASLSGILDQFQRAGTSLNSGVLSTGVLTASGGQIVRSTATGMLSITSPCTIAVCGEFPIKQAVTAGDWTLISPSGIGALMVVSLDGKPLSSSRAYIVKMVTRAENTAQELEAAPMGAPGRFRLKTWGKTPILTFGRPGDPLVLKQKGKPILSLALENGTWELIVRNGKASLMCDTPGVRGTLFGQTIATAVSSATVVVSVSPPATESAAKPAVTAKK